MILRNSTSGFTLIELIVGMTIFSIGLTGIFALLQTTMRSVRYSQDEIIVSGILREQLDLVNNIRDTNVRNYIPWDSVLVSRANGSRDSTIFTGGVYTIENSFSSTGITFDIGANDGTITNSPIKLQKIDTVSGFMTDSDKWNRTQLIFDEVGRYTHTGSVIGTPTNFASYIIVSPLGYSGAFAGAFTEIKKDQKNQGWIIDARVIVRYNGGYREYDAKSMITDWQK